MSFNFILVLLSSFQSTQQHKEHHVRKPLIAIYSVSTRDGLSWLQLQISPSLFPWWLPGPRERQEGKKALMEELCRWEKPEEDVSYPWSGCWIAQGFSQQCRGVHPALLVQPLPARVPSRSAGLRPDQGITHQFPVDFHPILLCWAKSKLREERAGLRTKNLNGFLAPFRPRTNLFIADACWQKDNPVGQGAF